MKEDGIEEVRRRRGKIPRLQGIRKRKNSNAISMSKQKQRKDDKREEEQIFLKIGEENRQSIRGMQTDGEAKKRRRRD